MKVSISCLYTALLLLRSTSKATAKSGRSQLRGHSAADRKLLGNVVGLELIDTISGKRVATLLEGTEVNLDRLPSTSLNINAVIAVDQVASTNSVKF